MNSFVEEKLNKLYNFLLNANLNKDYSGFFEKFAAKRAANLEDFKKKHPKLYEKYETEINLFWNDKITKKYFYEMSNLIFYLYQKHKNDESKVMIQVNSKPKYSQSITFLMDDLKSEIQDTRYYSTIKKNLINNYNINNNIIKALPKEVESAILKEVNDIIFKDYSFNKKVKIFTYIIKELILDKTKDNNFLHNYFQDEIFFVKNYYHFINEYRELISEIKDLKKRISQEKQKRLGIESNNIDGILKDGKYIIFKEVYDHQNILEAKKYMDDRFSSDWGVLKSYYNKVDAKINKRDDEGKIVNNNLYDIIYNDTNIIATIPHTTKSMQYLTRSAVVTNIETESVEGEEFHYRRERQCTAHVPAGKDFVGGTGKFDSNEFYRYTSRNFIFITIMKKPYKTMKKITYTSSNDPNNLLVIRYNIETKEINYKQRSTTNLLNRETFNRENIEEVITKNILDEILKRVDKKIKQNKTNNKDMINGNPTLSVSALKEASFQEVLRSIEKELSNNYKFPLTPDEYKSLPTRTDDERRRKDQYKLYYFNPELLPIDSNYNFRSYQNGLLLKPYDERIDNSAMERIFEKAFLDKLRERNIFMEYLNDAVATVEDRSLFPSEHYDINNAQLIANSIMKALFADKDNPIGSTFLKDFIVESLNQSPNLTGKLESMIGYTIRKTFNTKRFLKSQLLNKIKENNGKLIVSNNLNKSIEIDLNNIINSVVYNQNSSITLDGPDAIEYYCEVFSNKNNLSFEYQNKLLKNLYDYYISKKGDLGKNINNKIYEYWKDNIPIEKIKNISQIKLDISEVIFNNNYFKIKKYRREISGVIAKKIVSLYELEKQMTDTLFYFYLKNIDELSGIKSNISGARKKRYNLLDRYNKEYYKVFFAKMCDMVKIKDALHKELSREKPIGGGRTDVFLILLAFNNMGSEFGIKIDGPNKGIHPSVDKFICINTQYYIDNNIRDNEQYYKILHKKYCTKKEKEKKSWSDLIAECLGIR